MSCGANINDKNNYNETALMKACKNEHELTIKKLLHYKPSVIYK